MNKRAGAHPRWVGVLLMLLATLLWPAPRSAATSVTGVRERELFRIERSKNRNVVLYAARVRDERELDASNPVVAYWVLLAEDGRRDGLSWLEQQFAYGFSIERKADCLHLELIALRKRSLELRQHAGRWRAELPIRGKLAVLKRIWVQTDEGLFGPQVRFIDLHGIEIGTRRPVSERLVRN